ncbi:MAG: DUF4177 domain-containing protein [Bacillota bacterium]
MKRYEYVKLNGNQMFGAKFEEHRAVIDEYAQKGFSFVGYIPTQIGGKGDIFEMDLVFEIDVETERFNKDDKK